MSQKEKGKREGGANDLARRKEEGFISGLAIPVPTWRQNQEMDIKITNI